MTNITLTNEELRDLLEWKFRVLEEKMEDIDRLIEAAESVIEKNSNENIAKLESEIDLYRKFESELQEFS